ncbi:MAG: toxin hemolysin-type protein, partial [Devosia sp.]|uniref:VCBS domain-containing protein n=1 Tax=Devosia sp. TaxID=1871048 RepID=UPI00261C6090
MAAINKGIVTSFGNTPQAVDDVFNASALGIGSSGSFVPIFIDVMDNDKAGGAKTLYSLDDGTSVGGIRPADLLTQDTARTEAASTDTSKNGARIWISNDGKVGYDASTLSATALSQLQSLGAGQYFTDTFTYAIRMANGTLSWATVEIKIAGTNDAASITGPATGSVVEDTAGQLHAGGTLVVSDVDAGENIFQAP